MTSSTPKVSVFMPVYNAGPYLIDAMNSILEQDFTDFEFVIVNDGSTDSSVDTIKTYTDPRIRLVENEKNVGLIASLNIGLEICQGQYIVRMDQDDISLPGRIRKQVEFLDANPSVGLLGSWFEDFGEHIESRFVHYDTEDEQIRLRLLYQTHISHPTAVMRSSVIKQHQIRFDPEFVHGEDYNCWVNFSRHCKLANIPEVLVRKRDHPSNITNKYAEVMHATCTKVKRKQFDWMGAPISPEEADLYTRFADPEWNLNTEEMNQVLSILERMVQGNANTGFIRQDTLRSYLATKWFHLCYNNPQIRSSSLTWLKKASFYEAYKPSFTSGTKMKLRNWGMPV
jgi:glycosyltransferase involved in cell wall biosynthesis